VARCGAGTLCAIEHRALLNRRSNSTALLSTPFLQKPWDDVALLDLIHQVLDRGNDFQYPGRCQALTLPTNMWVTSIHSGRVAPWQIGNECLQAPHEVFGEHVLVENVRHFPDCVIAGKRSAHDAQCEAMIVEMLV
jgi:hypothetical protein